MKNNVSKFIFTIIIVAIDLNFWRHFPAYDMSNKLFTIFISLLFLGIIANLYHGIISSNKKLKEEDEIQMKKKWYLQTWFICLLCALWMFIVPVIVGIILLILQIIENQKTNKKYGAIDNLEYNISNLNNDIANLEEKKKRAANFHN